MAVDRTFADRAARSVPSSIAVAVARAKTRTFAKSELSYLHAACSAASVDIAATVSAAVAGVTEYRYEFKFSEWL